jgi:hypothetical protein
MQLRRSIILFAIGLVSCQSPVSPPEGVVVTTALSESSVGPGASVEISVVVTNISTLSYRVPGSAGGCIAAFEVRDPANRVLEAWDPRICDAAARNHLLAPDGTLSDKLRWRVPLTGLSSGVYQVRGRIAVVGFGLMFGTAAELRID